MLSLSLDQINEGTDFQFITLNANLKVTESMFVDEASRSVHFGRGVSSLFPLSVHGVVSSNYLYKNGEDVRQSFYWKHGPSSLGTDSVTKEDVSLYTGPQSKVIIGDSLSEKYGLKVDGGIVATDYLMGDVSLFNSVVWAKNGNGNLYFQGGNLGIGTVDIMDRLSVNGGIQFSSSNLTEEVGVFFWDEDKNNFYVVTTENVTVPLFSFNTKGDDYQLGIYNQGTLPEIYGSSRFRYDGTHLNLGKFVSNSLLSVQSKSSDQEPALMVVSTNSFVAFDSKLTFLGDYIVSTIDFKEAFIPAINPPAAAAA